MRFPRKAIGDYIAAQSVELAAMANEANMPTLAYIFGMAAVEARMQVIKEPRTKAA